MTRAFEAEIFARKGAGNGSIDIVNPSHVVKTEGVLASKRPLEDENQWSVAHDARRLHTAAVVKRCLLFLTPQ